MLHTRINNKLIVVLEEDDKLGYDTKGCAPDILVCSRSQVHDEHVYTMMATSKNINVVVV